MMMIIISIKCVFRFYNDHVGLIFDGVFICCIVKAFIEMEAYMEQRCQGIDNHWEPRPIYKPIKNADASTNCKLLLS